MRRRSTLLLNLAITLSLAFSGMLSEILIAAPVATGASSALIVVPGPGEVDPELAARRVKRERRHDRAKKDREQDRKQKDRKTDQKKDRKKDGKQKDRKRNRTKGAGPGRELDSGRLPGAVETGRGETGRLSAEGRYIVILEDSAGDALGAAADMAAAADGVIPTHVYEYVFPGFAAIIPDAKLNDIRSDPRVKTVMPDQVVRAYAQTLPTGIDRIDADQNPTAKIDGNDERVDVDVAVIDTAGDDTHPDLNVWAWANCTSSPNDSDDDGHGTHVGGTIGALDNSIGVVGVAPGARLWNLRVLQDGWGYYSWIICGLDLVTQYATDQGDGFGDVEVANLSLGGPGSDSNCLTNVWDDFHQAICRTVAAGVTVVVAAGNETDDAANHTPAAYDEVITVSALADYDGRPGGLVSGTSRGADDSLATFSNFGADIDIAAPGVSILSTVPGGYARFSGTSMASPHVAGAAALYLVNNPGATPAQVKSALISGREAIALANDPDGIDEGVLHLDGEGSPPPSDPPPGPPAPPRRLPAPPPPTDDFTWPEIEWVAPVGNNQHFTTSGGMVGLKADATDSVGVDYVEFWRYNATDGWVWISTDQTEPYQSSIDVSALDMGHNELSADAYDAAGNWNYESIFVERVTPPPPPDDPSPPIDPGPQIDEGKKDKKSKHDKKGKRNKKGKRDKKKRR